MSTAVEQRAADERRVALRALLLDPFVGSDDAAFALVRRHEPELARTCAELLGYRLEIAPGFARLFKQPTASALERGIRVRPGTAKARERARDEWPLLSHRGAVLLPLTMAALERAGRQTVIGELGRAVAEAGARCDPRIPVDLDRRAERVAFADGLDLLCHWGVLRLVAGVRESFARADQGDDEALFTIDRRRLASLMRDPFRLLGARSLDALLDDSHEYAPGPEGEARRLRHRLARCLAEDPALHVDALTEEERRYFASQRPHLERRVAEATGLRMERRAEGTAAVSAGRELTDVPFPANSTVKQAALLLCERLAEGREQQRSWDELRADVRTLLRRHGDSWNRSPDDPAVVDDLLDACAEVLAGLALADVSDRGIRLRPLAGRFRAPAVRRAGSDG